MAEQIARVCPPFRWRLIAWLAASRLAPPGAAGELRASLFNRMTSLVTSAIMIFAVTVVLACRHPGGGMLAWPVLDGTLSAVRLVLAAVILRHRARNPAEAAPATIVSDVFMLAGLLWCASLGYGTGLCLATGEPAISTLGGLIAMGTMAAQCGRVPGAPRLVVMQLCLVGLPICAGACLAPDHLMALLCTVAPAYMVTLVSINRQLHKDFVELIATRLESRHLALRCPLTGLPNRRMFDRALAHALAAPCQDGTVHVLCLDLDGFKSVNDTLGHPAGDLLLTQVSQRMLLLMEPGVLLARIGGDEFAILGALSGRPAAEALAQRLVATLNRPFPLSGADPARIGVSVGIASAAAGSLAPEALFSHADQAMYAAKRGGRNRLCWHETPAGLPGQRAREEAWGLLRPSRKAAGWSKQQEAAR